MVFCQSRARKLLQTQMPKTSLSPVEKTLSSPETNVRNRYQQVIGAAVFLTVLETT
jgi:hypothetical protein